MQVIDKEMQIVSELDTLPEAELLAAIEQCTEDERLFIFNYVHMGCDPARACNAAGLREYNGHRLVMLPRVRRAIELTMKSMEITTYEIAHLYAQIARGSMEDFLEVDEHGATVNLHKAQKMMKLGLVKKIKWSDKTGLPEIEMYDRMAALEALARMAGMFNKDESRKVDNSIQIQINHVRNTMAAAMKDPAQLAEMIALAERLATGGRVVMPILEAPQGAEIMPQGATEAPQGAEIMPQGATEAPQGAEIMPQGATEAPQGAEIMPQGATSSQAAAAVTSDHGNGTGAGVNVGAAVAPVPAQGERRPYVGALQGI
jgi:hypothetical protein